MKLSVCIAAYRRHKMTVRHVEECLKSTRVPDEIIVVNDHGDVSLRDMLFTLKRSVPVIYAYVEQDINWNYVGAMNLGFWLSMGDLISIEDTDHIPDRNAYENALELLKSPEIDRVAFRRKCVHISELSKPMEEWNVLKTWGSNQMNTILRRDVYLRLKGQDERFAGNYGWSTYDWVNRYRNILKCKSATTQWGWAVIGDEGEPGMSRSMSPINHRIYRQNAQTEHLQHPHGVLNFQYTFERMEPNI